MLKKAYTNALSLKITYSNEKNYFQVYEIFKSYSYEVLRKFINYSFENVVKIIKKKIKLFPFK
jgi:hypothetical protein